MLEFSHAGRSLLSSVHIEVPVTLIPPERWERARCHFLCYECIFLCLCRQAAPHLAHGVAPVARLDAHSRAVQRGGLIQAALGRVLRQIRPRRTWPSGAMPGELCLLQNAGCKAACLVRTLRHLCQSQSLHHAPKRNSSLCYRFAHAEEKGAPATGSDPAPASGDDAVFSLLLPLACCTTAQCQLAARLQVLVI